MGVRAGWMTGSGTDCLTPLLDAWLGVTNRDAVDTVAEGWKTATAQMTRKRRNIAHICYTMHKIVTTVNYIVRHRHRHSTVELWS